MTSKGFYFLGLVLTIAVIAAIAHTSQIDPEEAPEGIANIYTYPGGITTVTTSPYWAVETGPYDITITSVSITKTLTQYNPPKYVGSVHIIVEAKAKVFPFSELDKTRNMIESNIRLVIDEIERKCARCRKRKYAPWYA